MTPTERLESLLATLREAWHTEDAEADFRGVLRPNGLCDITVISKRFEGVSGTEREGLFWRAFDSIPRDMLVYMTYCLLLTPDESEKHFSEYPQEVRQSCDFAD